MSDTETKINNEYMVEKFDTNVVEELRGMTTTSGAQNIIFDKIYFAIYLLVKREDIRIKLPSDIESALVTEDEKELYRKAQAYILLFQLENGPADLITPENYDLNAKSWRYPKAAVEIIHALGFNRPTLFTQR